MEKIQVSGAISQLDYCLKIYMYTPLVYLPIYERFSFNYLTISYLLVSATEEKGSGQELI